MLRSLVASLVAVTLAAVGNESLATADRSTPAPRTEASASADGAGPSVAPPPGSLVGFQEPPAWTLYKWYIVAVVALVASQGALIAGLLVNRTRRRRAEEGAHRQFAELSAVYRAAPTGLSFVDTDLRYSNINDYLADVHGVPVAAHLGRTLRQVVPQLADEIEPMFRQVLETGQPIVDLETRGTVASQPGVEHTWLVSHYPVRSKDGAVLGVNSVVQEITGRKRAEEMRRDLIHASRLALGGELTASIAHELNQPLGAILSNADAAELLLRSSAPPLDEVRRILDDIRADDERASELIRRLRGLLRKRELEMAPLDLNEVASEVLHLVSGDVRRRGVVVKTHLTDQRPVVTGDRVQLQQVLLNLILNGMDAMEKSPAAQRCLSICTQSRNGFVEVAVADSGHGIPVEQLPRVFDSFFTTRSDGMGLGLSIARSIVEAHRGNIWAENNAGGGAVFRVMLPVTAEGSA